MILTIQTEKDRAGKDNNSERHAILKMSYMKTYKVTGIVTVPFRGPAGFCTFSSLECGASKAKVSGLLPK